MKQIGVVHGRFQPLHIGHEEYILEAKKLCRHLIVGLTNSDPSVMKTEKTATHRNAAGANIFTFYERMKMVRDTLVERGLSLEAFSVVPFPISFPEYLKFYVPPTALHFLTVYDDWGDEKCQRLSQLGFNVHVLWRRKEKIITGTEIRKKIEAQEDISPWVSSSVLAIVSAKFAPAKASENAL